MQLLPLIKPGPSSTPNKPCLRESYRPEQPPLGVCEGKACVCVQLQRGVGGFRIANTLPKGPLLFSLSSGLKSHFNEYRVKLNGKSIMAIKAGGLHQQPERFGSPEQPYRSVLTRWVCQDAGRLCRNISTTFGWSFRKCRDPWRMNRWLDFP